MKLKGACSVGKESAFNVGDSGSVPGLGRSPGEGNSNPLQCSCLENSMDRGAWWTTVHGKESGMSEQLTLAPWKNSYGKPRQCIKKQRYHFDNKSQYSQSYGFSSSHVQMWELDHKEGWVPKNWCFQTMVLKKTLKNLLDSMGIQLVNPKGNQPWIFIGRNWCWNWSSNTLATWFKDPTH